MTRRHFLKGSGAIVLMGLVPASLAELPVFEPRYMTATDMLMRNAEADEFIRGMAEALAKSILTPDINWFSLEDSMIPNEPWGLIL